MGISGSWKSDLGMTGMNSRRKLGSMRRRIVSGDASGFSRYLSIYISQLAWLSRVCKLSWIPFCSAAGTQCWMGKDLSSYQRKRSSSSNWNFWKKKVKSTRWLKLAAKPSSIAISGWEPCSSACAFVLPISSFDSSSSSHIIGPVCRTNISHKLLSYREPFEPTDKELNPNAQDDEDIIMISDDEDEVPIYWQQRQG